MAGDRTPPASVPAAPSLVIWTPAQGKGDGVSSGGRWTGREGVERGNRLLGAMDKTQQAQAWKQPWSLYGQHIDLFRREARKDLLAAFACCCLDHAAFDAGFALQLCDIIVVSADRIVSGT